MKKGIICIILMLIMFLSTCIPEHSHSTELECDCGNTESLIAIANEFTRQIGFHDYNSSEGKAAIKKLINRVDIINNCLMKCVYKEDNKNGGK